jgi:hypothetical protein
MSPVLQALRETPSDFFPDISLIRISPYLLSRF